MVIFLNFLALVSIAIQSEGSPDRAGAREFCASRAGGRNPKFSEVGITSPSNRVEEALNSQDLVFAQT
jgi:hypothetical protein